MTCFRFALSTVRAHFDRGDFAQAAAVAERVVEFYPDVGGVWQLLGIARWAMADDDGARAALEAASCLVPLSPLAQHALASCYMRAGQDDLARLMYHHLAQPNVCPVGLLPKVAAGLGCLGEFAVALGVCQRLTELRPHHHAAFFGIAYYLVRLGRPPCEALAPLEEAHRLAPEMLTYRVNLALLQHEAGAGEQAYELLRCVPPEAISCGFWLRQLAPIALAAGDDALAARYYRQLALFESRREGADSGAPSPEA